MPPFERIHHRRVAFVLESLDADLLRTDHCLFGGGTAIALTHGEYRESLDIDFMVSDRAGYRDLRHRLMGAKSLKPITRRGHEPVVLEREARVDQYGIRMIPLVDRVPIKFEIVHEGRIEFAPPGRANRVGDVSTLTTIDMAASKLLANSDRWADQSAFSRDVLDLAVLDLPPRFLKQAMRKAAEAYGDAIASDAQRAVAALRSDPDRLMHCIQALSVHLPLAAMQQALQRLARRLAVCVAVT